MSIAQPPTRSVTDDDDRRTGPSPAFGRKWDLLLIAVLIPAFAAIAHITHMLIIGDWDFWADWKDRQWWPFLSPMVGIVIPAAAQYIVWRLLGIPGGATAATVMLVLSQWASRFFTFHAWVYYPLAFVSPATMIPMGIALDLAFLLTRSWVLTSIVGGMAFGVLFQPANVAITAGMWVPVVYHNEIMTVADVMGFEYLRTQAPSYLRIVEEGHLRAFIEQINIVVGLTAGVGCIAFYWGGYALGRFVAFAPAKVFIKTKSPILGFLHPGVPEDRVAAPSAAGVTEGGTGPAAVAGGGTTDTHATPTDTAGPRSGAQEQDGRP
jgi:methane/ammonia monooxygenase subunit A